MEAKSGDPVVTHTEPLNRMNHFDVPRAVCFFGFFLEMPEEDPAMLLVFVLIFYLTLQVWNEDYIDWLILFVLKKQTSLLLHISR